MNRYTVWHNNENGDAFGGRWWEDDSRFSPRRYYEGSAR